MRRGSRIGALLLKSSQRNPIPRRTIALLRWEGTEVRTFGTNTTNNTAKPTPTSAYAARTGSMGALTVPAWPTPVNTPSTVDINRIFLSAPVVTSTMPILLTVYPKLFKQYRVLSTRISLRYDRTWLDPTLTVPNTAFNFQPMYAYIVASVDSDAFDTSPEEVTFLSLAMIRQQRYHKLKRIDPSWTTTATKRISMTINQQKMLANPIQYKIANTIPTTAPGSIAPYTAVVSDTGEAFQHAWVWWGIVTEDGSPFGNPGTGTFTTRSSLSVTQKLLFNEQHSNQELSAL